MNSLTIELRYLSSLNNSQYKQIENQYGYRRLEQHHQPT